MKLEMMTVLSIMMSVFACDPRTINGEADARERDPDAHPEHHVLIWVDPSKGLPAEEMRKGCDAWFESGVGCNLVADRYDSDVQIYVATKPCEPNEDGVTTLAYAVDGGTIVFNTECFKFRDGRWKKKALAIVAGHEFGHQLGIWSHVERSCVDAPIHPLGDLVCGVALMNPYYRVEVPLPRKVDGRAFDIRLTYFSVIDAFNHHAGESQGDSSYFCEYTTRP